MNKLRHTKSHQAIYVCEKNHSNGFSLQKPRDLNLSEEIEDFLDHKNRKTIFNDMEKSYSPNSYDFYYRGL